MGESLVFICSLSKHQRTPLVLPCAVLWGAPFPVLISMLLFEASLVPVNISRLTQKRIYLFQVFGFI